MKKRYMSWDEVFHRLTPIDKSENIVYGIPKGGMIAAGFLLRARPTHEPAVANVILDDIVDSGKTMQMYQEKFPRAQFYALIDREDEWIVFPWEVDHPAGEDTVEDNIVRQLQYIGEDPKREGLLKTPQRIVKAWNEIFCGYQQDTSNLFTTFEPDGYDQMVLLKDIELYSMCEHHILPFFGKAHVAYIPNGRVIGISKLARLVDIYARRLQIQERIGEQVTTDLMSHLFPKGAACIIEATHMCMRMRGVGKQNSIMLTSSLKGVFMEKPEARAELMGLIK